MAERPKHIQRALDGVWTQLRASGSSIAFGDFQQVTGYLVRLERQVADWERPSLWRRIRTALAAWNRRRLDRARIRQQMRGLGR